MYHKEHPSKSSFPYVPLINTLSGGSAALRLHVTGRCLRFSEEFEAEDKFRPVELEFSRRRFFWDVRKFHVFLEAPIKMVVFCCFFVKDPGSS